MSHLDLFILIFLCKISSFMDSVNSTVEENYLDIYRNEYGGDYGTKWIYFPDGDGELHYINLTITEDDMLIHRNSMLDDIEFRLYVGNDTESYVSLNRLGKAIKMSDQNLTEDIFHCNNPIKIITHGWLSSADKEAVTSIKNAYLEAQNMTVITVDWSCTANSILYFWVANETKTIGGEVADFLEGLNQLYNVTTDKIHLIGHSLGAHVMGIAASKMNSTVYRVTGLDPARPFFELPPQDRNAKLDPSDAEIVDVIHTCAGLLGFEGAIGTVDFYPNAGIAPQPGCEDIVKFFEGCSHGRSYYYFTESIKYPTSFPAYQCQSWMDFTKNRCSHNGFMGESVSKNMSGKFYLKTNAFEPFGIRLFL